MSELWIEFSKLKQDCYGIQINPDELFGCDANNKCMQFIQEHFFKGEKGTALEFDFQENYKKFGKHKHTVCLYLIGISLKELFDEHIKDYLGKKNLEPNKWYSFEYVWFLTCLYHDVASCTENIYNIEKCSDDRRNLGYYKRKYHIMHSPYDNNVIDNREEKQLLSEQYFKYRLASGRIDHGILGGYLFFEKLSSLFESAKKRFLDQNEFIFKNRYWNEKFVDLFALIADAIISHNMWTIKEDDSNVQTYKDYGLDILILQDHEKGISLEENPIQFMLCLLDSIEIIKRFDQSIHPMEVLRNVSVSAVHNNTALELGWRAWAEGQRGFGSWRTTIEELEDWMNVKLEDVFDDFSMRKQDIKIGKCTNE